MDELQDELLIFDLETNGLLPEVDRIHCLVTKDATTGEIVRYNSQRKDIKEGVQQLRKSKRNIGHNILDYDLRVLDKLKLPVNGERYQALDTLVCSRLIWPDLKDRDFAFARKNPESPKFLIGSHSLKAWGYRLCNFKSDYTGGWESWNQDMEDYCVQDTEVTSSLYQKILSKNYSEEAIQLEHDVARIILRQSARGFCFDEEKALLLYRELRKRIGEVEEQLVASFPPWYSRTGTHGVREGFIPKVNNATHGYTKGAALCQIKLNTFNPGSRDHIGDRLMKVYGWKPKAFGADGKPTVDETTLEGLPYPEIQLIIEYLTLGKRIGQLSEGKQALMKLVKNGRIHGEVNTNGAVTGRMTHNSPNVAQTPANRALYGERFRELYRATPGWDLTGADAEGLELRCLAHYMAAWDDGDYARVILEGDVHTSNQIAAGLTSRDDAKTFIYAFLYGAGDEKIGSIVGSGSKRGRQLKAAFLEGLPALKYLLEAVKSKAESAGVLRGLDGRLIPVRSPHAALNTLLQGAGAVVMKKALVILDDKLQQSGLVPGVDYEFVANIHDEYQIEHRKEHGERIRDYAAKSITLAGEHFKFRCRLDGKAVTGTTWADTH